MKSKEIIGFIGQGFVGKSYADDFENRGYEIVRYSLEEPYIKNKDKISDLDVVFVAVPTPTQKGKFDISIVRDALSITKPGSIVVIKSTMLPGTTELFQKEYPEKIILFSPEFLMASKAAQDAAKPKRNIVGIPDDSEKHQKAAELVMKMLPKAPYENICSAREAEYIKYGGNCFLYLKVIFANLLYDLAIHDGCNWQAIKEGMAADERIGYSHMEPIHHDGVSSDGKKGRGAGGLCFIKDFAAFSNLYRETFPEDREGIEILESTEMKNIKLLTESEKDIDLLKGVYGEKFDK